MAEGVERRVRRPQTAQQVALMELREAILLGRLKPGDPIRQEEFALQLGLSRVPVREAMKMLEGEGLLQYSPHHGYTVTQLSREEIVEIYRVRTLLEDEAIRVGVPLIEESDVDRLRALNEQLELALHANDLLGVLRANRDFHTTIFDRGCTSRLKMLIRLVWDSIEPYRSGFFLDSSFHSRQLSDHAKIIEAVKAGDVELSLSLSTTHRQRALDAILKSIDDGVDV